MVNVKVKFPIMLIKALDIEEEIEIEGVENIIDVYEKLSEMSKPFADQIYPGGVPNRRIGVIINESYITSDDYETLLIDGCEVCFQLPVAGG